MKQIVCKLSIVAAVLLGLSSCKEEPPAVDFSVPPVDTTYVDGSVQGGVQLKNVLIEDFTGVKCINCPKAQTQAKLLQNNNPGRVVVVGLHPAAPSGFESLCAPYNTPPEVSKYDFRTDDARNIMQLIGTPGGLPAGAINRKLVNSERTILQYNTWPTVVSQELAAGTNCKIEFTKKVTDSILHVMVIRVKVTYYSASTDSNYLTIGLTESHMIDLQEDGGIVVHDYEHNHVLRKLITSFSGNLLDAPIVTGRVFEKEYTVALDSSWKTTNMHVYALVHKDAVSKDVLQCAETELY